MLLAELAVFVHLNTFRIVLLVLLGNVVALLALGASQSHLNSHIGTSYYYCLPWGRRVCLPQFRAAAGRRDPFPGTKIKPLKEVIQVYHISLSKVKGFLKFPGQVLFSAGEYYIYYTHTEGMLPSGRGTLRFFL